MTPGQPPTSPAPVVPSKNALRALRRLALSPSILIAGTLGSVCGLATLGYEVNRRVHLAEQIVERKKLLRSLSQGRANKQLNAMFEAAERGEDFTLNSKLAKKRRRKNTTRIFSASQDASDGYPEVIPEELVQHIKKRLAPVHTTPSEIVTGSATWCRPSREFDSNMKAISRSAGLLPRSVTINMNGIHGRAVGRIVEASQAQHKSSSCRANGRPRPRDLLIFGKPSGLPKSYSDLANDPSYDLKLYMADSAAPQAGAESNTSISPQLLVYNDDEPMYRALKEHLRGQEKTQSGLRSVESLIDFAPKEFKRVAAGVLDTHTFAALNDFIQPEGEGLEEEVQFRRWQAAMRYCIQGRQTPDFVMAEAIFYGFRPLLDAAGVPVRPVFDLIRHLLATEPTCDRLRDILFSPFKRDWRDVASENSKARTFQLSTQYLTLFSEIEPLFASFREMMKINDVAKRCGLVPNQSLVIPILRAMVRSNDFQEADIVLEQLESLSETADFAQILGEYAFSNACNGNWKEVNLTLERLHIRRYSRDRPSQYSRMFHKILLQHNAKNSAARSFGFTLEAIRETGLIPTALISRTLICACIKERRYDLITQWARLVDEAFPRVCLGFKTLRGAWILANTLREVGASCQEIAKVCQTIARGRRQNPFGDGFRDLSKELVRVDLIHRLRGARAQIPGGGFSTVDLVSMTLDQLLDQAYYIATAPSVAGTEESSLEHLKRDIAVQLSAINELDAIFSGDVNFLYARQYDPSASEYESRRNSEPEQKWNEMNKARQSFPEVLTQDRSPGVEKMAAAILDHYARRKKEGLPVNHSLLSYVMTKFGGEYSLDVLRLVEAIHASKYVQGPDGVAFDDIIFMKWLSMVTTAGSDQSAVTALWAVIDSARHLRWTAHFSYLLIFLCQMDTRSVIPFWDDSRGIESPKTPELAYLQERIRQIRLESPDHIKDNFRFPEWRQWEMASRASLG